MNKIKKNLVASKIIYGFVTAAFLILPFLCMAAEGNNLWNYDSVQVAATYDDQKKVTLASDGIGGAIIVWHEYEYFFDDNWKVKVQRLDEDGNPLWTAGGVEISSSGAYPIIAADDVGGAVIAWQDSSSDDIYAQRINASGTPLWGVDGVLIGTGGYVSAIVGDGSGGAFIVFSLSPKIAHINSSGVPTSPGFDGISLGGGVLALGDPVITQAGSNEAIVAWTNGVKNILAQKVTSSLTLPWGATPVLISDNARKEIRSEIAADGSGGAIITWARQPEVTQSTAYVVAQRISHDGICLWTPGGVILVDSSIVGGSDSAWRTYEVAPVVAAGPIGGAIIAWNDWRDESATGGNDDLYAQRLDELGVPQWAANGIKLHTDSGNTSQRRPRIASDGGYGAIVTFQDMIFYAYSIYAVILDADGIEWRNYVYYDGDLDDPGNNQTDPVITFDGTGPDPTGAIIAWIDERGSSDNIYAQKIEKEHITLFPDLIVESIVINPPLPDPYEAFTVDITFRNQSAINAGVIIKCGFNPGYKPFSFWDYWYLLGLEAGGTSTRRFDYPDGRAADTYTLSATIDPDNSLTESDETNNYLSVPLIIIPSDTDPPTPSPMTWELEPYQTSTSSIFMEATTANDPSPPIRYFYNFTTSPTGGSGGSDSPGWSLSTGFVNGGLSTNHQYGYQVKARDALVNETAYSAISYEYTNIETPTGIRFGEITPQSIQAMILNKLSGLTLSNSGWYIQNSTARTDSGWKQDSDYWLNKGLSPNTRYDFMAKARNGDGQETSWCTSANTCTLAAVPRADSFYDVSRTGITANWNLNGNPKTTAFYCENMTAGTNSGWIMGSSWVCKGLSCNIAYTFRVKAKNLDGVETEWCKLGSQSTLPCPGYYGDFDEDGDVDGSDLKRLANDTSLLALSSFAANFGRSD